MNEKEVESLLKETKAILEGHFLLTSGLHSPLYVEKFNVLQHPEYTEKLCQEFANHFKDMGIETVIGPATGQRAFAAWNVLLLPESSPLPVKKRAERRRS